MQERNKIKHCNASSQGRAKALSYPYTKFEFLKINSQHYWVIMSLELRKQPENYESLLNYYKIIYVSFHLGRLVILLSNPMREISLFRDLLIAKIMYLLLPKPMYLQVHQFSLCMIRLLLDAPTQSQKDQTPHCNNTIDFHRGPPEFGN